MRQGGHSSSSPRSTASPARSGTCSQSWRSSKPKGVTVEFIFQGLTIRPDGGDLTTRLILHIITAVAQSESEMIRERQAEGIAIAKQMPGKYPGR